VSVALAISLLTVACSASSVPDAATSRPDLPRCLEQAQVYLPVTQGPEEGRETTQHALDCFWSDVVAGQPVELEFTLLGTEGEEYQAVIQHLEDGTVNYFRETDGGWVISIGCSDLVGVP